MLTVKVLQDIGNNSYRVLLTTFRHGRAATERKPGAACSRGQYPFLKPVSAGSLLFRRLPFLTPGGAPLHPGRSGEPACGGMLWESKIELGEAFFNEIIRHPVPLDMNTLKALKRCAGLDLYLWLTYRTFGLKSSLRLSWKQLYRQFGLHPDKASDNRTVDTFRTKCLRELKKIKMSWPDLKYSIAKGVLILHPSKPAIAPAEQRALVN